VEAELDQSVTIGRVSGDLKWIYTRSSRQDFGNSEDPITSRKVNSESTEDGDNSCIIS